MITSNPRSYEVWTDPQGFACFGAVYPSQREPKPTSLAFFARIAQARAYVKWYNRKLREGV